MAIVSIEEDLAASSKILQPLLLQSTFSEDTGSQVQAHLQCDSTADMYGVVAQKGILHRSE